MLTPESCRKCKKRMFDPQMGLACSITSEAPDEGIDCPDFEGLEEKMHAGTIYAPRGIRFLNHVLDTFFYASLGFVTFIMFQAFSLSINFTSFEIYVFAILFRFFYFLTFEAIFQRTPAKWITRSKVVDNHGEKPAFVQILGRTFCRLIPFESISFLASNASGIHDMLSKTRVIILLPEK